MDPMKNLALVALLSLGPSVAIAEMSLKDTKQMEEWNKHLQDGIESHKSHCGYAITAKLDPGFVKTKFVEERTSAGAYCAAALEGVGNLCDDATSKPVVAKKVKKLTCKPGPDGSASFKLAGGELQFTFGLNASNLPDQTKKYLEEHL
jgi:hypothetical protein